MLFVIPTVSITAADQTRISSSKLDPRRFRVAISTAYIPSL